MPNEQTEILKAACCVAAVGGEIKPGDTHVLRRLVESTGVRESSYYTMIDRAVNEPGFYRKQVQLLTKDVESSLITLIDTAAPNGHVCPDERNTLQRFAEKLGVRQGRFRQMVRAVECAA